MMDVKEAQTIALDVALHRAPHTRGELNEARAVLEPDEAAPAPAKAAAPAKKKSRASA